MRKVGHLINVVIVVLASIAFTEGSKIRIVKPLNGAEVSERPVVEGTVPNRDVDVWVIVHPMEVSDYWVQQKATVNDDGSWMVQIHVGRPGTDDIDRRFEIMAVANPRKGLRPGTVLPGWPEGQWQSQVIRVTRKF